MIDVRIQSDDFSVDTEIARVKALNLNAGGITSFVGCVRDVDDTLIHMQLEHYPQMTEKTITTIINQAQDKWRIAAATVIHRVGTLYKNDNIVLVIVAARHRKEAFLACEFIMDFLKTKAPFWKKETTKCGEYWVEKKDTDEAKSSSWLTDN